MNETVHDIPKTVLQMTSLRCTILYCLNCYLVYERDSTWYCEYCTANWRWTNNRRCFQSEPGSHKVIFIYTFFTDNILARKCLSLRKFAALVRLGQPTAHRFSLLINSLINFLDRVDFEVSLRLGLRFYRSKHLLLTFVFK